MPVHNFQPLRGRVTSIVVRSRALRSNVLGDPADRRVDVYLPPGYDTAQEAYPLVVVLAGFTGSGPGLLNWRAFDESVPQRLERLTAQGLMGPVVAAFPDCFTTLGGNQYINSTAVGLWEDFLVGEMLPALEAQFRLKAGSRHRAVLGKSSGGYGALVHGMRHPQAWHALACHSGDMMFEWAYKPDLPDAVRALARYEGNVGVFMKAMREGRKIDGKSFHALMTLAMAATYDPDPAQPYGVRLPVRLDTCELIPERWQAWLAHDPVIMAQQPAVQDNLRQLGAVFFDCGTRDQYRLLYGARVLHRELDRAGVAHRYEEFDDDHSGINYRMDISLPLLYAAIN